MVTRVRSSGWGGADAELYAQHLTYLYLTHLTSDVMFGCEVPPKTHIETMQEGSEQK